MTVKASISLTVEQHAMTVQVVNPFLQKFPYTIFTASNGRTPAKHRTGACSPAKNLCGETISVRNRQASFRISLVCALISLSVHQPCNLSTWNSPWPFPDRCDGPSRTSRRDPESG